MKHLDAPSTALAYPGSIDHHLATWHGFIAMSAVKHSTLCPIGEPLPGIGKHTKLLCKMFFASITYPRYTCPTNSTTDRVVFSATFVVFFLAQRFFQRDEKCAHASLFLISEDRLSSMYTFLSKKYTLLVSQACQ